MARGFSTQIVLGVVAGVLVLGLFLVGSGSWKIEPTQKLDETGNTSSTSESVTESNQQGIKSGTSAQTSTSKPKPKPPVSSGGSSGNTGTSGAETSPTSPTPGTTTEPTPTTVPPVAAPVAWSANFQASTRVVPEIPSENERATLPSCNGLLLGNDFINLASVKNIVEAPVGDAGSLSELLSFVFLNKAADQRYILTSPGDVYVTYIKENTGVSADAIDMTIYFALCKDVFGYFTNVKELSIAMQRVADKSGCFGKPQSGPYACPMILLEQIGRGSSIGNVGLLGGSFGFGLIDLRSERTLPSGSDYPVRAHYSHCPLGYVMGSSGIKSLLSPGTLCGS